MRKDHYEMIRKNKLAFWWYKGRRDLFQGILRRNDVPKSLFGLDAGCGPLTNESLYATFADKWIALDHSTESFKDLLPVTGIQPAIGDLSRIPAGPGKFGIVLLLDVLEHVDDEAALLLELKRVIKEDGHILLSVPAFMALWSRHDEQAGHRKRYRAVELRRLCSDAGLEVLSVYHFNTSMFLPIYVLRKILKMLPAGRNAIEMNLSPPLVDPVLTMLLRIENVINLKLFRLPFGTSLVLLARKKDE